MFGGCYVTVQGQELMQYRLNGSGHIPHFIIAVFCKYIAVMRHLIEVVSDTVQVSLVLGYERIKQVHRLDTTLHERVIIVGHRIADHGTDATVVSRLCLEHIPFRTAYPESYDTVFVSGIFHGLCNSL